MKESHKENTPHICPDFNREMADCDERLQVHSIKYTYFAIAFAGVPFFSMWACFILAMVYQAEQVNETVCQVKNVIPSISAITSTAPNRYMWRIAIALHSTPSFYVGHIYYNFYSLRRCVVSPKWRGFYNLLVSANLLLSYMENIGFIGTAYISNRDDYPIHEKLFIMFMVTSIASMIFTCIIMMMSKQGNGDRMDTLSLQLKLLFLFIVVLATAGMLFFYYRHKVLCEEGAFSLFAFFEYWIAVFNIAFHFTSYIDFRDYEIRFFKPVAITTKKKAN